VAECTVSIREATTIFFILYFYNFLFFHFINNSKKIIR